MPTDKPQTINDYVTLQRGSTYQGSLVGEPGPPLLGLGSIEPGGGFRRGNFTTYGGECPEKWMVQPGDIYIALKGATKDGSMVGSAARLPLDLSAGRLTQDTARLDFHDKRPEVARHLYWVLQSPQYRAYCEGRVMGSASASFSRGDFLSYKVPPLSDDAIAIEAMLDALDDKIEHNSRTAAKLEELARATFRAWFVDFAPAHAKAAGATSYPGLPPAAFAALPTTFTQSIPEGWAATPLDAVAKFLNGLALQKYPPRDDGTDLPVIKIAQLRKGTTEGADSANNTIDNEFKVKDRDLLFSWSGTLEAAFWFGGPGALNQHLFKVTSDQYPAWLVFEWIQQHLDEFRLIASSKATTMGHIKRSHLKQAIVAVPPAAFLQLANKAMSPLYDLHAKLQLESRKVAGLRDYLLPRLLSGAVRVEVKT